MCKLNPVTQDEDLELIFGRFGKILSCEVIRDQKTGDSLQYAFIEYEEKASCEAAYFKMQGVLIDDRRIHVDFSQSVSKLSDVWRNDTNDKRKKNASRGGWGGVRELEKRRQYRNEDERRSGKDYGLVYGNEEMRGRHERTGGERRQDPPPVRDDDQDSRRRHQGRSRSPRRRDRSSDRYHNSKDNGGHRDRRDRDRPRHRDDRRYDRHRNFGEDGYRSKR